MPRRYTDKEKRKALDCLRDCDGNFRQTSQATGIPLRTLQGWAQRERDAADRADTEQAMVRMRQRLVENVLLLADSLEAKIDDAPLNQHASALGQLVDRLIKLADKLPQSNPDDDVIRIEFVDADGSVHQTPYWSRDDSDL